VAFDRALGDGTLHGVAPDAIAAITRGDVTTIQAPAWHADLAGNGGPLARAGALVVAAASSIGPQAEAQGSPATQLTALDAATGAERWRRLIEASDWVIATALAGIGDDALVGGSFSGTLRIQDKVVSSGGRADGFVARLTARGDVAWLVRVGGPSADAVQGLAVRGDRIAIAGTFGAGADLLGAVLPAADERSPLADGFVAELAPDGTRRWSATFGGKGEDAVAGVAIDGAGRVVVAATARGSVTAGGGELVAQGPADGLLVWFDHEGERSDALLVGNAGVDGLSAIVATHGRIVVAGFHADAGFLASYDGSRQVTTWPLAGEVTALAALPHGVLAGVASPKGIALLARDVP
jgi:outer membrane protein assembly factor BamB